MRAIPLPDDPGRGDPAAIAQLARCRSDKIDDVDGARHVVEQCGTWAATEWVGQSSTSFCSAAETLMAEFGRVREALGDHHAALEAYGREVDDIASLQRGLEAERSTAEEALRRSSASLAVIEEEARAQVDLPLSSVDDYRAYERTALQGRIDVARGDLDRLGRRWDELVERRETADRACLRALQATEVDSGFAGLEERAVDVSTPTEAMMLLDGLSAFDIAVLLAEHPRLADLLGQASPELVREWWDSLALLRPIDGDGFSAAQLALIAGAPAMIGNLDGVPPPARVKANAVTAARQVVLNEATLAGLRTRGADPALIDELEREIAYLRGAAAVPPTVQLYTYDRAADRIVEMIGDWNAPPQRVYTYVPGTLSEMRDFWASKNRVQDVSRYLVENDHTTSVAFVYKDGRFPGSGGTVFPTSSMPLGPALVEANREKFAISAGQTLADFQRGIRTDPLFAGGGPQQIGVGHSWGLANVTSSEVAGASYDNVVSLAGAGAVNEWHPQVGTAYDSFRYADILGEAQKTGAVYWGKNPQAMPTVFDDHLYESDADRSNPGDWSTLESNHSLIAQVDRQNERALRDVLIALGGEAAPS
jgi:hypothetical protein